MDDATTAPPSWGSDQSATPADPASSAVSRDEALAAFNEALSVRVIARLQELCGAAAVDEYLDILDGDDLAKAMLFEAQYKVNLEQLRFEQEAALINEMESRLPGSTSFLFSKLSRQPSHE